MCTMLWIVAGLLAVVFAFSSVVKLSLPIDKLAHAPAGGWVEDVSAGAVRDIGALEILVPLGLILPAVLDIAPVLVPLAAGAHHDRGIRVAAVSQRLEALPAETLAQVYIEVAHPDARLALPDHPGAIVAWWAPVRRRAV